MCWLVDCDKYFTVYTCHMVTRCMVCVYITLSLGSPPSDMVLQISCGALPQECAQAADDSDLDPALSTRALSFHF